MGSVHSIDVAKAIATLITNGGELKDFFYPNKLKVAAAPIIAVPTTAGSGSEVTPFAVISDKEKGTKENIIDIKCSPAIALLDPNVLLKAPHHIMASTGIDAMVHAIEAYTCNRSVLYTDIYAIKAIELIANNLINACENHDIESCTNIMLASNMAGIAFGYSDVAAIHCLAEALGGQYNIPHGVACSIFLPTVTEYNIPSNPKKYADIARAMGIEKESMTTEQLANSVVPALKKLCQDLKLPKLKDIAIVDPIHFKAIAIKASQNASNSSNPVKFSVNNYLDIIKKTY
ncbi:iron-containing alcohol dehydrogenase [Serratia marcescens]|uniref:iron-containing alcohol dehydrogenase n=1 Tax=Serratia marcescens TaxID=615 RepID=UPI00163A63FE|nr:iron-containing alcohol dehydrogenase [Serratia marcescens]HEJ7121856.1 iron-containing alcohol dehydrogenase [Serratia marcescens]